MATTLFLLMAAAIGTTGSALAPADGGGKSSSNAGFLAKNYPPESLKRGEQGRVEFQLSFDSEGAVTDCAITRSSGFRNLDDGTCELLARSARADPVRDSTGRAIPAVRTGFLNWKLPDQRLALGQIGGGSASTQSNPLVCRRFSVPGSMIKKVKRCMTKSEWELDERLTRQQLEVFLSRQMCGDHGC
jgi:TonB family protein